MLKHSLLLFLALSLLGCITPGPLGESEFIEQVLPVDHDTALENLRIGWQKCDFPQYGQPSYIQFKDHTIIDVYGVTLYLEATTKSTIGRIELWKQGDKVRMRAGIHRNYINGTRRENWIKWATGNYQCDF